MRATRGARWGIAAALLLAAACSGPATTETGTTGTTGSGGSVPGTAAPWEGRTTHVRLSPDTPTTFTASDLTKAHLWSGSTDDGVDLPVMDVDRDWWISIGLTEHMNGIASDADGLTHPGAGCQAKECTHVVVTAAGEVRLPNRHDRTVDELPFDQWSVHDAGPPIDDLPPDAPPLDAAGRPTAPTRGTRATNVDPAVRVLVEVAAEDPPILRTRPTYDLSKVLEAPPEAFVSVVAADGRHVIDLDPAGHDGFTLDPHDPATPPGRYVVGLRTYSRSGTWAAVDDADGADVVVDGVVTRTARCATSGCVAIELREDGSVALAESTTVDPDLRFAIRPLGSLVTDGPNDGPPLQPTAVPTAAQLRGPDGSVVVDLRQGSPGDLAAPGTAGFGVELASEDVHAAFDSRLVPGAHVFVFTDVPAGDHRVRPTDENFPARVPFEDATGTTVPYEGAGVHPQGSAAPASLVTLWAVPPTPVPPTPVPPTPVPPTSVPS